MGKSFLGLANLGTNDDKYELLGIDWKEKRMGLPTYVWGGGIAAAVYYFFFRKKR